MIRKMVFGSEYARWAEERLGMPAGDLDPCGAFGIYVGRVLVAAVVFNNHRGTTLQMTIASVDPSWCSRAVLRGIFHFGYRMMKCKTLLALTKRDRNKDTKRFLHRVGFRQIGIIPHGFDDQDGALFALPVEACKWMAEPERARAVYHVEHRAS